MAWLEMTRVQSHGGSGWEFGECLWSPTRTKDGRSWAYWTALEKVSSGDVVVHLRGRSPKAAFVGYSIADATGYETTTRPTDAGDWNWSQRFYRVPLREFTEFAEPIPLAEIFRKSNTELVAYHAQHSPYKAPGGKLLFYVQQAGRLQCQNGAYLTQLDEELSSILFGAAIEKVGATLSAQVSDVTTSQQVRMMDARLGQQAFSEGVRRNFGNCCCFPGCTIAESSFLVGSHIARWADASHLRGSIANGLCLCVLHDRAFERGLFTLTKDHRVVMNTLLAQQSPWAMMNLPLVEGQQIRLGPILPSEEALSHHWERISFRPL